LKLPSFGGAGGGFLKTYFIIMSKANDTISIIVRVMPRGDELEVELPLFSTGKEIIEELLSAEVAPRRDPENNPYVYELISKVANTKISDNKTLFDVGIRNGETLYLAPKLVAGSK
jgi:hypothetical protein